MTSPLVTPEVRWGDTISQNLLIPGGVVLPVTNEPKQVVYVHDRPRVWSLMLTVLVHFGGTSAGEIFNANPVIFFGIGQSRVLFNAVPVFTFISNGTNNTSQQSLIVPNIPADTLEVAWQCSFTGAAGHPTDRIVTFDTSAMVAPYTRVPTDGSE